MSKKNPEKLHPAQWLALIIAGVIYYLSKLYRN